MRIKFNDGKTEYTITSITNSGNVVTIKGKIPANNSGFKLLKDKGTKSLDFSEYNTVYRLLPDGVQFSNNGSIATKTVVVAVQWDDGNNKKGIRPSSVDVNINGAVVSIGVNDNWQVVYKNFPVDVEYIVTASEVEGYDLSVMGTVITYKTDYPIDPTVEEQIEEVNEALDMVMGEVIPEQAAEVASLSEMVDSILTDIIPGIIGE